MHITRLAYQSNGAHLFAHFANQPYAVFIDSCGVDRFDIIAAQPRHVLNQANFFEDPFIQTKNFLNQFAVDDAQIPDDLPFTLGAIGYFSYDVGFQLVQLNQTNQIDITLPNAVMGFYDWSIIIDHQEQITYLISLDDPSSPHLVALMNFIAKPHNSIGHFSLAENFLPNMNKTQYALAFEQIKKHIAAGDCYQINLAQRFSAAYHGSPWVAYQRLRQQNPMPMAAFINLPEGAILCLSPERFLQVNKRQVVTCPIKGTSPRFINPHQDAQSAQALLSNEKDRAEKLDDCRFAQK